MSGILVLFDPSLVLEYEIYFWRSLSKQSDADGHNHECDLSARGQFSPVEVGPRDSVHLRVLNPIAEFPILLRPPRL